MTSLGVVQRFRKRAAMHPDRLAIQADDRSVTYAELAERVERAAGWLAARGVGEGDRVAFLGRNRIEFFEVLLATKWLGAAIVPVNWRFAAREVEHVVGDAEPVLLVVEGGLVELTARARQRVPTMAVLELGDAAADWGSEPAPPVFDARPDSLLWLVYTSGTTGLPKGVMVTHGNFLAMFDELAEAWRFLPGRVTYMPYPIFHGAGILWVLGPLLTGGTALLRRQFDPSDLMQACATRGVTNTMMVPAVLQRVLTAHDLDPTALANLRTIVYGVAPISEAVVQRAIDVMPSVEFIHAYGLTEATGTVTYLPWAEHRPGTERMRSCGRRYSFVELEVRDPETGAAREVGEVGEVWVRGPIVMAGYFRRPDDTAAAITPDGWLRTGDAGYLDEEGYLYLTDRVKDMIVTGGENVYPAEVENVLYAHPAVLEAAVVGVPSERWGETAKAFVVLRPGATATEDELIAFCREELAHYKCPTSVELLDELPRNATGKVLRRELREPYWQGIDRRIH